MPYRFYLPNLHQLLFPQGPRNLSNSILRLFILSVFLGLSQLNWAQYTVTNCQGNAEALIARDRNNWAQVNLDVASEGYLHNFPGPALPCGLEDAILSDVIITIEIIDITTAGTCNNVPIFGNVLLNCPLTTTASCLIVQDVLSPGCQFGIATTTTGVYTLNLVACGVNPSTTDLIGVDIIPAADGLQGCQNNGMAISDGFIDVTYTICIEYVYDQPEPVDCGLTVSLPCDDGDPCTANDQIIVDECDEDLICQPCAGVPQTDCSDTVSLPCDDGDDCTVNDQVTVEACDNSVVCIPCGGQAEADCSSIVELPCDDGDPCTINDVQSVSQCNENFICVPCAGESLAACATTEVLPCDDGDPCTVNDILTVDACDNSVICIPCTGTIGGPCENSLSFTCDDGNPCTENDVEFRDACDNTLVCTPCAGTTFNPPNCSDGNCTNGIESWNPVTCECESTPSILGCTNPSACNYSPSATCNDGSCDLSCQDCAGVPYGEAVLDTCGVCLPMDDPDFNLSCLEGVFIPNAFTPDGDGLNDQLKVTTARRFQSFEWRIYNRFGEEVFYSNDPDMAWQGNAKGSSYFLPSDIYTFQLNYVYDPPEWQRVVGHISLIR